MYYHEIQELAARMLGIDPEAQDFDEDELEGTFYDKYHCDLLDSFGSILKDLIKFTAVQETWAGNLARGFVHDGAFIVKQDVNVKDGE